MPFMTLTSICIYETLFFKHLDYRCSLTACDKHVKMAGRHLIVSSLIFHDLKPVDTMDLQYI